MADGRHRSSEELIAQARSLMRESAGSWNSLAGQLEIREDRAWLDEGRKRYHASAAMTTSVAPDETVASYIFSVIRAPRRARMRLTHSVPDENPETYPELVIVRDQTWWAKTGSVVETNVGDAAHGIGLFGLELMICPQPLADTMDYCEAWETRPGGSAILLSAGASEMIWFRAPELVVLSASEYELEVDRQLGILLASRAYIDNRIARNVTLSGICVNPPFDDQAEFGIPTQPEGFG